MLSTDMLLGIVIGAVGTLTLMALNRQISDLMRRAPALIFLALIALATVAGILFVMSG